MSPGNCGVFQIMKKGGLGVYFRYDRKTLSELMNPGAPVEVFEFIPP